MTAATWLEAVTTQDDPTEHTWQPNNLIQLAENPPAPPTIGGLLYPAKRTVLSGETESMKTWLALILCKAELDIGLPVGWVDLDAMGPGALLERLQLLGVDDDTIAENFLYYEPSEMLTPEKTRAVTDTIEARGIRLFVIDAFNPILSLHGLDPDKNPDIEKFWRHIADPITRAGAAPVLLDHVVKNADNRGKYSTGSERKASGAIVHIGFKLLEPLTKGGRGRTLLNVHKDRPGYLQRPSIGRLVLTSDNDGIHYEIEADRSHDGDTFTPTVLMEKVSRYLEPETAPLSKKQIEDAKLGKSEYVRKALDALVQDGYLTRQDGARGAHLYTTIRAFREAEAAQTATSSPPRPDLVPNLRSVPSSDLVPTTPFRGSGTRSERKTLTTSSQPRPRPEGEPIHEYEFPPLATDEPWFDEPDEEPTKPGWI
jgi:hypothetical protein